MVVTTDRVRFYWRITAIFVCLVWIIVFLVNLLLDPFPQRDIFIPGLAWDIFTGITIIGAGFLIVFPLQFYIYAVFCCLWGLINIVNGGGLSGMLMYAMGLIFAYRKGFFKTIPVFKAVLAGLALITAMLFQIRYGVEQFTGIMLEFLELSVIAGLIVVLFHQELAAKMRELSGLPPSRPFFVTEKELRLDRKYFTGQDLLILQTILAGGKYEAIAVEQRVGLSTLKKRVASLFSLLDAADRGQFLKRYRWHDVVWDDGRVKQDGVIRFPG